VPSGLVDAVGRPDWNAKLSVAQTLLYLPLLGFTIRLYGIEGAAMAWSARCALDCACRMGLGAWLYPPARSGLGQTGGILLLLGLLLLSVRLCV
jgi:hypothetical protein